MRGVFQRVTRGQALQIPAEVWNQFGAMAFGGEQFGGASPEAMARANLRNDYNATQVIVFNDTGSDLPQWGIVSLGAPTFIPSASGEVQQTRTVLTVVAPSAGAFFGVCQNAIPDGACGTAIVSGVTPCILNVTASGDTHADATTSTTELTTGTSGRAEIIYKASGTGAGKLGVVLIGGGGSTAIPGAEVIDLEYVSKVCPTYRYGTYGTEITGISVERKTVRVLGYPLEDATECTTGDTDCCPVVTGCCENPLPRIMAVVLEGTGDCTCFDYVIPIHYLGEVATGVHAWGTLDADGNYGYTQLTGEGACGFLADSIPVSFNFLLRCNSENFEIGGLVVGMQCLYWIPPYFPDATCDPFSIGPLSLNAIGATDGHGTIGECCGGGDVTLTIIPFDGVADLDGGDSGTGECCSDTSNLSGFEVALSDDFEGFGSSGIWVYDPSAIGAELYDISGDYDGRFQWYMEYDFGADVDLHMFFGCLDGQYYVGFLVSSVMAGCLDSMTGFETFTEFVSIPVTVTNACSDSVVVEFTLTGDGTTGCDGTITLRIYR